jgi:hypothetical protein
MPAAPMPSAAANNQIRGNLLLTMFYFLFGQCANSVTFATD